jgi:hypothetical protein
LPGLLIAEELYEFISIVVLSNPILFLTRGSPLINSLPTCIGDGKDRCTLIDFSTRSYTVLAPYSYRKLLNLDEFSE